MTTINYTYIVTAVHERTMEVQYTHPIHGTLVVGARRPKVGETVEQVVAEYSPAAWWLEQEAEFAPVEAGITGEGATEFPEPPAELTPEEALELWRARATISQLQAHYTLKVWGLYEQVVDLVTAVGDPLELAFHRATEWRRNSLSINELFGTLTMPGGEAPSPEDVDRFFQEAAEFIL